MDRGNGIGLAGLIFSTAGYLTCGAMCVPGVVLSAIGLHSPQRSTAIAGIIVGLPGAVFFLLYCRWMFFYDSKFVNDFLEGVWRVLFPFYYM